MSLIIPRLPWAMQLWLQWWTLKGLGETESVPTNGYIPLSYINVLEKIQAELELIHRAEFPELQKQCWEVIEYT